MNKVNYQKQLDELLRQLPEKESKKKLLLHSCCAPCSSYVLEYLRQYFDITVLYYNPNITEREEYEKRAAEQKRLIREMNEEADGDCKNRILAEEGRYDPERFSRRQKAWSWCRRAGNAALSVMKSACGRLHGLPESRALTILQPPLPSAL